MVRLRLPHFTCGTIGGALVAASPGRMPVRFPPGPPRGSTRAQPSWTARQTHRHADADRRYLADYRPPRPRLAPPRRAHRPPLRTILLRRCPRPPRTHPDPALPGIRRPPGHRGVPGQQRPVHRVRTARLFRGGGRYPEQEVDATFILYARSETGYLRPSSGAGGPGRESVNTMSSPAKRRTLISSGVGQPW